MKDKPILEERRVCWLGIAGFCRLGLMGELRERILFGLHLALFYVLH
jgi:hypothetical protein